MQLSRLPVLLTLLLFAVPAAPAMAFDGSPPDPGTTGPWAVGHTRFDAVDPDRGDRTLAVELWYPVDPEAAVGEPTFYELLSFFGLSFGLTSDVAVDGPPATELLRPLILFSHGSGGINVQSISLMETLASHGFVVASPNHTGNSTFDEEGDVPYEDPATDRPKDLSFLIDLLLERSFDSGDPLYLAINPLAIGVTGHSFGGFTALAMAAGYDESDFGPVPPDRRVGAIMPVSPTSSLLSDKELRSIRVPTFFLGGTADTAVPLDPNTTRPFELVKSKHLFRADIVGATHTHFANICDIAQVLIDIGIPPGTWPAIGAEALVEPYEQTCLPPAFPLAEAVRIQNLYTVAFFRRHLLFDLRYEAFLTIDYADANEPDVEFFAGGLSPRCGLGFELVLVLPVLMGLHRRRRRLH
jgi:predicted dienelactone hydrolase